MIYGSHDHVGRGACSRLSQYIFFFCFLLLVEPSVEPDSAVVDGYKKDIIVELRCNVRGQPPPLIHWFFQGERLQDSTHYCLPENGSLLVVDMTPSLAGEYLCKVENILGSSNATVELRYAGG